MGTACSSIRHPDTSNVCSAKLGDEHSIPHFCTLAGSHNDTRRAYCRLIGDAEWDYSKNGGTCTYDDGDNVSTMSAGCCKGSCGVVGRGVVCKRIAFRGDPFPCCLQDLACDGANEGKCFSDDKKSRTCDPEFRDLASNGCRKRMVNWCSGITDNGFEPISVWSQRWLGNVTVNGKEYSQPCLRNIYRNMYNGHPQACLGEPSDIAPDSAGFIYSQNLIASMIQRYYDDGGRLNTKEDQEGNSELNALIWSICNKNPGLCTTALSKFCANLTPDDLARDTTLLPWCGCHLPPEEYSKYTDLYQVNKECTPTCNISGIIGVPSDDGTTTKVCKQSTCIIDDVSIKIAQSTIGSAGDGIDFSQLCSSCSVKGGTGTCSCTMSGLDFTIVDSQIPELKISQQCGSTSQCYREVEQPDGSLKSERVSCTATTNDPYQQVRDEEEQNRQFASDLQFWKTIIIFAIVAFIVLALFAFFDRGPPKKKNVLKVSVK